MGKGSIRRPSVVDDAEIEANWDSIFKRVDRNVEKTRYVKKKKKKEV